ncbi:SDR family NAD(P)-dependent oxidoreductase [Gordonia jinghuaiqii]|uniref:SDR family NAD(P)-dependent oxidoreductase n=1 Tax=Gordonia jinghuaiqii TaxID=2758710 RepID=A0A7D7LWS3_9ACTN|nr:SDR family NAD(P)-dependent oxidoreductase [Gordonia jinghuaiqii]MCR5977666.1 SDR family NAD(P)-dependent oxidoreductase [Gordonia jinghuaiqii]QMT02335.1 SDR family NAD(P)-dependent oxidoreductase [Gordonia jinghuaiqii]
MPVSDTARSDPAGLDPAGFDPARYGPWAVIAGGSEGVGASFALQLADAGVDLVLIARKPGPLEETAEAVRARGVRAVTLSVDLTESSAIDEIIAATADLDVGLLVYNAGANSYGSEFVTGDLDGFRTVIDLNITAQLALVHHFGRRLRDRGRGGLLLVGSMSGYLGGTHLSVYGGVKAFGRVFAESLWLELRDHGVDVLELVLGVTRTPAMERAGLNLGAAMGVSEPDDVAREGLEHLADGPVWIAGGNAARAEKINGPDRRKLILRQHEAMSKLFPRRGEHDAVAIP